MSARAPGDSFSRQWFMKRSPARTRVSRPAGRGAFAAAGPVTGAAAVRSAAPIFAASTAMCPRCSET
jgi:hypothetical protein